MANDMKIKSSRLLYVILTILFICRPAIVGAEEGEGRELVPSYKYMVVYGTGNLEKGDTVEFFDRDGTLCGRWVVGEKGAYGLMAVYGDDPTTNDLDEGAKNGELLTVRVNGVEVNPPEGKPVWRDDSGTRRIDL